MLYGIVLGAHIIVCLFLIIIVLIQSGRGAGLAESFSGAESIFGTKTNVFLTRATTVMAILFFLTCLGLATLSKQRSKSLLLGRPLPAKTNKLKQQPQEKPGTSNPQNPLSLTNQTQEENTASTSRPQDNTANTQPPQNAQNK